MFFKFPYVDMYTLNLDWMIKYLEETKAHLEQWQELIDSLGTIVHSVNGQTGNVNLGTLVNRVNGQTGDVNLGTLVNSVNGKTGDVEIDNDDINALKIECVLQTTDPANTFTPAVVTPLFNSGIRFIIINNKEFYSITEAGAMIQFNPFEDLNISKELAQPPANQAEIESLYNQGVRFIRYTVSDVVKTYALEKIDSVVMAYDLDATNGANLFNFIDSNETIADYSTATLQSMYNSGVRFLFQDETNGIRKFYALLGTEINGYTGYTEYDPVSYFDTQFVPSLQQDINNLKSRFESNIDNIHEELMQTEWDNITSSIPWDIAGYYPNANINGSVSGTSSAKTSIFSVNPSEKYRLTGKSNFNQKLVAVYDSGNTMLLCYSPDNEDRTYNGLEITIPTNGAKMMVSYFDSTALANFRIYKQVYVAKDYLLPGDVTKEDVDFIEKVQSVNLYDSTKAVRNKVISATGAISDANYMFYAMVPIDGSGYYSMIVNADYFGEANAKKITLFDSTYAKVTTLTATKTGGSGTATEVKFEIINEHILNRVKYIGLTGATSKITTAMVVKGETYPTTYYAYFDTYYILDDDILTESGNEMIGKIAIFDGDSISNGASAVDGSSGWASYIGIKNKMDWQNYSVGGGCITYISGTHCISRTIDTIHTEHQTLDYLILEGGTNDADQLHNNPSKIGEIDSDDFGGVYDDTTYCGALDSLFYKAINYYPDSKIGFVIAMKMGTNQGTRDYRYHFFELAMQACKKWGIPYINLWDECQMNPSLPSMYDPELDAQGNRDGGYLYTDGQHLTAKGYTVINPKVEAWMKTL